MDITAMLDTLAELHAKRDLEMRALAEAHTWALAPIKAQLDAIDIMFGPKLHELASLISSTEQAIKDAVLTVGTSAQGSGYQAVYMSGRVSWDTQKLDGYAVAHPEIAAFRSVGAPSVQIRAVKGTP